MHNPTCQKGAHYWTWILSRINAADGEPAEGETSNRPQAPLDTMGGNGGLSTNNATVS